jgi:hypothetical protein
MKEGTTTTNVVFVGWFPIFPGKGIARKEMRLFEAV